MATPKIKDLAEHDVTKCTVCYIHSDASRAQEFGEFERALGAHRGEASSLPALAARRGRCGQLVDNLEVSSTEV